MRLSLLDGINGGLRFLYAIMVKNHWMKIQEFEQYKPREIKPERYPSSSRSLPFRPGMLALTPTFQQGQFLEETLLSVLDQNYPGLEYGVEDGGSTDGAKAILEKYSDRLKFWNSTPGRSQNEALRRGFEQLTRSRRDAIMFWINSDDLLLPGSLSFVADFFGRHPEIDVLYGHRIIIDEKSREIGRWVLPRHSPSALKWVDYIPQETLFWQKKAWDRVGGLDPSFQFAMDWDLLLKFHAQGLKIVRLPYFLGCFRFHPNQKTASHLSALAKGEEDSGEVEINRLRERHNPLPLDTRRITYYGLKTKILGSVYARFLSLGFRF